MTEPGYFDIDQHRLDEEWIEQPRLYHRAATTLAEARLTWEKAKAEKEIAIAELDQAIRLNPDKYGLLKVSEASVEKAIIRRSRYRKATDAVIAASHAVDVARVVVDTLDHKKKGLENMVHLFSLNYFAAPKAPEGARDRMQRVERDAVLSKKKRKDQ